MFLYVSPSKEAKRVTMNNPYRVLDIHKVLDRYCPMGKDATWEKIQRGKQGSWCTIIQYAAVVQLVSLLQGIAPKTAARTQSVIPGSQWQAHPKSRRKLL